MGLMDRDRGSESTGLYLMKPVAVSAVRLPSEVLLAASERMLSRRAACGYRVSFRVRMTVL